MKILLLTLLPVTAHATETLEETAKQRMAEAGKRLKQAEAAEEKAAASLSDSWERLSQLQLLYETWSRSAKDPELVRVYGEVVDYAAEGMNKALRRFDKSSADAARRMYKDAEQFAAQKEWGHCREFSRIAKKAADNAVDVSTLAAAQGRLCAKLCDEYRKKIEEKD